jgi:hypothetical protein
VGEWLRVSIAIQIWADVFWARSLVHDIATLDRTSTFPADKKVSPWQADSAKVCSPRVNTGGDGSPQAKLRYGPLTGRHLMKRAMIRCLPSSPDSSIGYSHSYSSNANVLSLLCMYKDDVFPFPLRIAPLV